MAKGEAKTHNMTRKQKRNLEKRHKEANRQRSYFPGETRNNLVALGLLDPAKDETRLECTLICEMINEEHGKITHEKSDKTAAEMIEELGLGTGKGRKKNKTQHPVED